MNENPIEKPADEIVEDWFCKHFHNSAASRNTEIYNQILAAKDDLKAQLTGNKAVIAVEDVPSTTEEDLNHGPE